MINNMKDGRVLTAQLHFFWAADDLRQPLQKKQQGSSNSASFLA